MTVRRLVKHVMLSIQNEEGRPNVSIGVELVIDFESDSRGSRWVARESVDGVVRGDSRYAEGGADALGVICGWLARWAPVKGDL